MGAWGYKAFDNDTACEWLDGFLDLLRFTLNHAFWSQWEEEGIAAAQVLSDLPDKIQECLGVFTFNEALEVVGRELAPEKALVWKHPAERTRYILGLKRKLTKRQAKFPKKPLRRKKILIKGLD